MKTLHQNKPKSPDKTNRRLWCIMKAHGWHSISVGGIALKPQKTGPQYFIPVFDTEAQAVAWSQSGEHVRELETVTDDGREDGNSPSRNQGPGD